MSSKFPHDVNDVIRFEIQHENGKICAARVDYDKPWGLDLARSLAHSECRLLREVSQNVAPVLFSGLSLSEFFYRSTRVHVGS